MSAVKRWYIGVYNGEAQARACAPHPHEFIRDTEGEIFVIAEQFDACEARNRALQQRLTAADELADSWHSRCVERTTERDLLKERADVLEGLLRTSLVAMSRIYSAGRDFIVGTGCDCDSVELMMENDPTAREIRAALKPAEGGGDDA